MPNAKQSSSTKSATHGNRLTPMVVGLALTTLVLVAVGRLLYLRWTELTALPLNELGDLLSGVCSTLALLWLVVGFFQQQQELRQNTSALRLQHIELARQVDESHRQTEETRNLARSAERQAKVLETQLRLEQQRVLPLLVFSGRKHQPHEYVAKFTNKGGPMRDISARAFSKSPDKPWIPIEATIRPKEIIEKDHRGELKLSGNLHLVDCEITVELRFTDALGLSQNLVYDLPNRETLPVPVQEAPPASPTD